MDSEPLKRLPPVLRAIIKALGIVRAQAFLAEFGGCYVTIPQSSGEKLGLSDVELVMLRDGLRDHLQNSDRLSLPKVDKVFIWFRDQEIRINRTRFTLNELAVMYKLSSRHIQNICNDDDPVSYQQDDLFN